MGIQKQRVFPVFILLLFGMQIVGCSSGIEPSPEPSLLRVTIQADSTDNYITLAGDTMLAAPRDSMQISVFQGKAFNDTAFIVLFQDTLQYRQTEQHFNVLERDVQGDYKKFTIFESFVPPYDFDRVQFGIDAQFMFLTYTYDIGGIGIPMERTPGEDLLVSYEAAMEMNPGELTEVNLKIKPFESASRYRDIFRFTPTIYVESVRRLGEYR